jgi:hypothetical protein
LTIKFCVYFALSNRFRDSVICLCSKEWWIKLRNFNILQQCFYIMFFHVSALVQLLATVSLVLNLTIKFCVYFALSNRFRDSVICLCPKEWWNKVILTCYNSVCHIMLFQVSDLVQLLSTLSLVLNLTFKFCVYFALSNRFRDSVICLCSKEWWNKLILTIYNSVCHIMLFQVSDLVQLLATLSLVLNSTSNSVYILLWVTDLEILLSVCVLMMKETNFILRHIQMKNV